MAMDTVNERASAMGQNLPPYAKLPLPAAGVDASDRMQIFGLYIGIESGPPPVTISGGHMFLIIIK